MVTKMISRTHEECYDCSKQRIEPPICKVHALGPTCCPEFSAKQRLPKKQIKTGHEMRNNCTFTKPEKGCKAPGIEFVTETMEAYGIKEDKQLPEWRRDSLLDKLRGKKDPLSILYMWCKQNAITLTEFKTLISYIYANL